MSDGRRWVAPERVEVRKLGIEVTPLSAREVCVQIAQANSHAVDIDIAGHNLHSVYLFHTEPRFRRFYQSADVVLADGWPILRGATSELRARGGKEMSRAYRTGSTDWIPLLAEVGKLERVAVIGAEDRSNAAFVDRMSAVLPSANFLAIPAHPWRDDSFDEIAATLSDFDPQLTLLGLGMPLQEIVAGQLRRAGVRGALATVGGAIDQLSGKQKLAPRWLGRLRIEWLWRLLHEPKRLWRRYLLEPIALAKILRRSGT